MRAHFFKVDKWWTCTQFPDPKSLEKPIKSRLVGQQFLYALFVDTHYFIIIFYNVLLSVMLDIKGFSRKLDFFLSFFITCFYL